MSSVMVFCILHGYRFMRFFGFWLSLSSAFLGLRQWFIWLSFVVLLIFTGWNCQHLFGTFWSVSYSLLLIIFCSGFFVCFNFFSNQTLPVANLLQPFKFTITEDQFQALNIFELKISYIHIKILYIKILYKILKLNKTRKIIAIE